MILARKTNKLKKNKRKMKRKRKKRFIKYIYRNIKKNKKKTLMKNLNRNLFLAFLRLIIIKIIIIGVISLIFVGRRLIGGGLLGGMGLFWVISSLSTLLWLGICFRVLLLGFLAFRWDCCKLYYCYALFRGLLLYIISTLLIKFEFITNFWLNLCMLW